MIWAARYVGAPFADGGRGPVAFDCWGLVQTVYRDCLGIELPHYGEISARDLLRVRREIAAGVTSEIWRQVDRPREFDVAVMRLPTGRGHGHVGVLTDPHHVLHVEAGSGAAIERLDGATIRNRIMGYWRHV
ncbi:C40 family peptidase [Citreimonas sp.]|uniref:C40 family peptidase n=1 Tax=Citreimonas sp. TaxID=3036715 RepID=UPI0040595F72